MFSGNRRSLRPRVLACVATAEVEQAEEIQTPEAAAAPSEAVERKQPVENVDSRRRGRPGQQRRPKKEVIYNINDLAVGQEVDAVVVRSHPSCCLCFPQETFLSVFFVKYLTKNSSFLAGGSDNIWCIRGLWCREGCTDPYLSADGEPLCMP